MNGNYIIIPITDKDETFYREFLLPLDNIICVATCSNNVGGKEDCQVLYKEQNSNASGTGALLNKVFIRVDGYLGGATMFVADVNATIIKGITSPNSQPILKLREKDAYISLVSSPYTGPLCGSGPG